MENTVIVGRIVAFATKKYVLVEMCAGKLFPWSVFGSVLLFLFDGKFAGNNYNHYILPVHIVRSTRKFGSSSGNAPTGSCRTGCTL